MLICSQCGSPTQGHDDGRGHVSAVCERCYKPLPRGLPDAKGVSRPRKKGGAQAKSARSPRVAPK